ELLDDEVPAGRAGDQPAGDEPADRIAEAWVLDLDHLRTPVAEHGPRRGHETPLGHLEHADAVQYAGHGPDTRSGRPSLTRRRRRRLAILSRAVAAERKLHDEARPGPRRDRHRAAERLHALADADEARARVASFGGKPDPVVVHPQAELAALGRQRNAHVARARV